MQEARIAVIEDDPTMRELINIALSVQHHEVVAQAGSLPEALDMVDKLRTGELEADVITLDGNLEASRRDCEHARTIMQAINEAGLTAWVIGLSSCDLKELDIPVHFDLNKHSISALGRVISDL